MGGTAPVPRRFELKTELVASLGTVAVVLYVFLRLPYALFYGELGTSPEELGLDQAQMLAQSWVLVALIAAVAAFLSVYIVVGGMGAMAVWHLVRSGRQILRRPKGNISDAEFTKFLETLRQKATSKEDRRLIALFRYNRVRPPRKRPGIRFLFQSNLGLLDGQVRRNLPARMLHISIAYALVLMLGVLPLLALQQAADVKDCRPATHVPGLRYGGAKVQLLDAKSQEPQFAGRSLLLLGSHSSRYILFDCRTDTTISVPDANYIAVQSETSPSTLESK